jgi:hypothetical protein
MTNYSKNEYVNVSVGFRVCSRYYDMESTWGLVIYSRTVGINLLVPIGGFFWQTGNVLNWRVSGVVFACRIVCSV